MYSENCPIRIKFCNSLIAIILLNFVLWLRCAGLTGVTNWKENTFTCDLNKENTFNIAAQAFSKIGKVTFADKNLGSINGEYKSQVDCAITVFERESKVYITIKSKLNVKASAIVIETGDRQKCIDSIVKEMKSLDCNLKPIK